MRVFLGYQQIHGTGQIDGFEIIIDFVILRALKIFGSDQGSSFDVAAAMTSTCTQACKFIDYGVRFFLK
jgi:hypothetical protein